MPAWKVALLGLVLTLGGCASVKMPPVAANPEAMQDWQVEGEFTLKGQDSRLHTAFTWKQLGDHYTLYIKPDGLRKPVSMTIEGTAQQVTVTHPVAGRTHSSTPNASVSAILGADFPVEQLGYWLRGLQATAEAKTQSDGYGSLTRISEAGWSIRNSSFMLINDYRLPEDIELRHGDTRLDIELLRADTAFVQSCCSESELAAAQQPLELTAKAPAPSDEGVSAGDNAYSAGAGGGGTTATSPAVDGERWTLNMNPQDRENFRKLPPTPAWINRDDFIRQLIKVHGKVPDPNIGLFGPQSMMWKLGRDIAPGGLGAGRALLLQIAHPWITRGIDEHSSVRKDPLERGRKTFKYILTMIYGSLPQAMQAAHEVSEIHSSIKGRMPYDAGVFKQGSDYSASEINAMIWVQATLWDTLVVEYEAVEEKLTDAEKEQFYQETKLFAMLFGIPESALPKNWQAFMEYNRSMWESGQLAVTPQTKELAHYLFHPNIVLAPLMWVQKVFTAAHLPEPLRSEYGLDYGTFNRYSYEYALLPAARITDRMLPSTLRYNPVYHEAMSRIEGERAGWYQRYLIRLLFRQERLVN